MLQEAQKEENPSIKAWFCPVHGDIGSVETSDLKTLEFIIGSYNGRKHCMRCLSNLIDSLLPTIIERERE